MILASTRLEEVLLALKIAFLVLLYLLIWRIIRTVSRDLRTHPTQESFIMPPGGGAHAVPARAVSGGRLVVQGSPVLDSGDEYSVESAPITMGRGGQNDVAIDGDEFASARHARFEPRSDGVWVQDLGSTNGTFVNGVRLDGVRRLVPGDIVRVGETELRFEP
jgi:FHA domain